ncbi:MAG: hypothetical protein AB7N76_02530 [Planctomycetota bacterium]
MADKDFPRLRADPDWKKLSAAHQTALIDYCRDAKLDTDKVREADAVLMASSLAAVSEPVRETFLKKLKEDYRRSPRLIGMTGTTTWEHPRLNGKPAAGAELDACRRRLIQVFSLLRDRELFAHDHGASRAGLLTNTIEWFIFANLPLEFGTSSDSALMGEYVRERHAMILYHQSLLQIGTDKIGDPSETVRKLAHEVNHACRRHEDTSGDAVVADELFAYVTELIAAGNTVTEGQIASTFKTLAGPPYNLKKVIDSPSGQAYRQAIRYQDIPIPDSNPVIFPLPSPGTPNSGWHHDNRVPGL